MFSLVWLNFTDAVFTFHLQSGYLDAKWIFFYIGLMRIVYMGTGLNSQIIGTSTLWRFDFITGMILLMSLLRLTMKAAAVILRVAAKIPPMLIARPPSNP